MLQYGLPVLYALFVWWFSTLAVIFLDNLPRHTFRWSLLGGTLLFGIGLYGLASSSADASVRGAYQAFTFGLLVWGWQELSFYTGYVTGPRRHACDAGCSGWRHFGHALQVSLYHELAIIASVAAIVWLTWGQPNQIGTWTFVVLWWMHESARLNVFLGVRNVNEEFLPEHLKFLRSFLTTRPMNLLFPISVTVSTVIAALLFQRAFTADASAFDTAGYTFLGAMMTLAILEHWFLVLPLPAAELWRWGLRQRDARRARELSIAPAGDITKPRVLAWQQR